MLCAMAGLLWRWPHTDAAWGAQVGPIAQVPYLRRVAVAHQLHHSEKYGGVPWGMFLGPQELEAVGAREELDRMVAAQALQQNAQRKC